MKAGDVTITYNFTCAEVTKSSSAASGTTGTEASTNGLAGPAHPTFPAGTKNELSVVANGPYSDRTNIVPVVVHNNTSRPVTAVEVQGSARDANGALVGSGSSQGIQPAAIPPGGIGIGYVYFGDAPNATQFSFTASAKPSKGPGRDFFAGLQITENNETEGERYGTNRGQIIGTVVNPLTVTVTGPISVLALCLDPAGNPTTTVSGFAEGDDLAAGSTTTFSLDFYDQTCPSYLVGASGYNHDAL